MSGWVSIHRKIQDHWLWRDKPFSKGQAWVDLLLMANHKNNKFLLGNELVEVERGSFITSEYKLMDKWGWSKTKVRNFLKLLEDEKMIVKLSDRKKTTLTIVNYSDYQVSETTKKPLKDHEKTTKRLQEDHQETTERPPKNPNNNDNNDNKYIDDEESAEKNPYVFYENNFGTFHGFIAERIKALEEDIGPEMVIEAMKIAVLNRAKGLGYVETIVKDWLAKNIKTPEDLKAFEAEKQRSKPKNQDQPLNIDYEASAKSKYGW